MKIGRCFLNEFRLGQVRTGFYEFFVVKITHYLYTVYMHSVNIRKQVRANYFSFYKFMERFGTEEQCQKELIKLKYPYGYICKKCQCTHYYQLHGSAKRARILQCQNCKHQESITANTIFQKTRTPLKKWFYVMYKMSQSKKGIAALQLSKEINADESTVLLMMTKIRKVQEENTSKYPIGGQNSVVFADEIEISCQKPEKQKVLVLLEKTKTLRRVRAFLIDDKSSESIEKVLIPSIKQGTILHTDGNPVYQSIQKKHENYFQLNQVAHRQENYSHQFMRELNIVVSNLPRAMYHRISVREI